MIREKQFYKTFFVLALSLALQNLLIYSVNMMDTVMLGRYSQNAMSGVSLCNQVQFMLQMLVEGAGEGAVVLGAQYWGKNKLEPIPHIIGAALRFGGGMAVLMFLIVRLAPGQLLGLLSNEPLVIAEGVRYFQIISFSYIVFTVTHILVASLRSVGIVKLGYIISFSTLCINISLNYLLIYGNFGFPELGVRGAAIATLVSRCVELLIVLYYLKFRERQLRLTLKKLVHTLEVLFSVIGVFTGLTIFLLRGPILKVFGGSLTESAYLLSMQFMAVIAVTTVGTSYQVACDNGIIRGGGDTVFSAKMNLISMWLIIVPLSALAAFHWNLAPVVVFFLLKWDQLYKIIPVSIRLHSWKWVRVVTRGDREECAQP